MDWYVPETEYRQQQLAIYRDSVDRTLSPPPPPDVTVRRQRVGAGFTEDNGLSPDAAAGIDPFQAARAPGSMTPFQAAQINALQQPMAFGERSGLERTPEIADVNRRAFNTINDLGLFGRGVPLSASDTPEQTIERAARAALNLPVSGGVPSGAETNQEFYRRMHGQRLAPESATPIVASNAPEIPAGAKLVGEAYRKAQLKLIKDLGTRPVPSEEFAQTATQVLRDYGFTTEEPSVARSLAGEAASAPASALSPEISARTALGLPELQVPAASAPAIEAPARVAEPAGVAPRGTGALATQPEAPTPILPDAPRVPRVPIWQQPIADAVEADRATTPAPAGAGGASPPPQLPSGRTPGGFGEPKTPITQPEAGAAVAAALNPTKPSFAEQVRSAADRLLREGYDAIYPLRPLDEAAGLPPNEGSHAMLQLVSGGIAAGEDIARRFVLPVLDSIRDIRPVKLAGQTVDPLEAYWLLRASEDVLAKYPHSKLPGNIDGWPGIFRETEALRNQVGPEGMQRLEAAAKQLWDANFKYRLGELQSEGIISPQQAMDLRNSNPHYLPFDRYEYRLEDPSVLIPRPPVTPAASVSGPGIERRTLGGATVSLNEPMARWLADIIQTQAVVSRNQAARSLVEALQIAERRTGVQRVVVGTEQEMAAAKLPQQSAQRGTITFFDPANPGVKMVANVDKTIADVAKSLEREPANLYVRVLGALAAPVRVGATALNIAFLPRNIQRDLKTAWAREGLTPEYWLRGIKAAVARNTDFSEAAQARVLSSGLLENQRSMDVLKRARALESVISVRTPQEAALILPRLVGRAPGAILRANEIFEQAPRIGTYLMLRERGLSQTEAAVRARDVTVDFSKSGNFVRMMNQITPFFNARVQGAANLGRSIRDDPVGVAARMAPLATISIIAWLWNQRYGTSNLIPNYQWDRNWVFQIGEGEAKADPRYPGQSPKRFPIYMKIAKGDFDAAISAPVEFMLRTAFSNDDRSVVEHALMAARQATMGLSPEDPTALGALSLIAPPTAASIAGITANYDLFRQRPIVPQGEQNRPPEYQYGVTYGAPVSKTAIALGQQFKVSPRIIDFAIQNQFGGAGQQVAWLIDLGLSALGYTPSAAPGEAKSRQLTTQEQVVQSPLLRPFIGASNAEPYLRQQEKLDQAVTQGRDLLYQNPEVRRFGVGVSPVRQSVNVGGVPTELAPEQRVSLQRDMNQLGKFALEALITQPFYTSADDAGKRKLIDLVDSRISENQHEAITGAIAGQAPAKPKWTVEDMPRLVKAIGEYQQLQAMERYPGLKQGQLVAGRAFASRLAATRERTGGQVPVRTLVTAVAREDPEGAQAFMAMLTVSRSPAGQAALRRRQAFQASHPLLQQYFGNGLPFNTGQQAMVPGA